MGFQKLFPKDLRDPLTKFLTKKRVPATIVYRNSEQVKTGNL